MGHIACERRAMLKEPEGKKPLGKQEDDIKIDFWEIRWGGVN